MERLTEKGKESKTFKGMARHLATINCINKGLLRELYIQQYDKLQKLEDLEEQIGISLDELVEQYKLYQQAFYLASWVLAEYDIKGCYDEMEASDEWKEILLKEADEAMSRRKKPCV